MHKINKINEQIMIHLVPEIKGLKHKNEHKIWSGHEHSVTPERNEPTVHLYRAGMSIFCDCEFPMGTEL
jgi:hypothetical protein